MSKEFILQKLEELGFTVREANGLGYAFKYEELTLLYMPDDDQHFLRFAVPSIYDVTPQNRPFVLEVANDTNATIKYSKTCVFGESVWTFYEHHLISEDNVEDIIENGLLLLQATVAVFHRKIEGDDDITEEDDDDSQNENEGKEDGE